jgi:hypothetical protein
LAAFPEEAPGLDTFLLILAVIYAAATVCLMAIGAGYQLKRWWTRRHGPQPHRAAQVDHVEVPTVTAEHSAAL